MTEEQLKRGDHLGLKKLFIGESSEVKLNASQIKYFYFENWSNSKINFQYLTTVSTPGGTS